MSDVQDVPADIVETVAEYVGDETGLYGNKVLARAVSYIARAPLIEQIAAKDAEIKRLREALAEYENPNNWRLGGRFDGSSGNFDGTSFAHFVLHPEAPAP